MTIPSDSLKPSRASFRRSRSTSWVSLATSSSPIRPFSMMKRFPSTTSYPLRRSSSETDDFPVPGVPVRAYRVMAE